METIDYEKSKSQYIIGKSPDDIKSIWEAVKNEYETQLHPLVSDKYTTKDGTSVFQVMEKYASTMVQYAVEKSNLGLISNCPDGCKGDIMFSSSESKNLLGIQVKTTSGSKNRFAQIDKDYSTLLMYFRSLTDGMAWLIPYNFVRNLYPGTDLYVTKGTNKINWDDYKVSDSDLASKIYEYYISTLQRKNPYLSLQSKESLSIPISDDTKKEHENRARIFPYLRKLNLNITMPTIENSPYDFTLGEIKVQEKTAHKGSGYEISLKRTSCNYIFDNFGLLLVHIPDFDIIYFIPTFILAHYNCMAYRIEEEAKSYLRFYPPELGIGRNNKDKENWTLDYMFYYKDPNILERLYSVYRKALTQHRDPLILKQFILWDKVCKNFNDIIVKWNIPRYHGRKDDNYDFVLYDKKVIHLSMTQEENCFKIVLYTREKKAFIKCDFTNIDFIFCNMPEKGFYLIPTWEVENILKSSKQTFCIPFYPTRLRANLSYLDKYSFFYESFSTTILFSLMRNSKID